MTRWFLQNYLYVLIYFYRCKKSALTQQTKSEKMITHVSISPHPFLLLLRNIKAQKLCTVHIYQSSLLLLSFQRLLLLFDSNVQRRNKILVLKFFSHSCSSTYLNIPVWEGAAQFAKFAYDMCMFTSTL